MSAANNDVYIVTAGAEHAKMFADSWVPEYVYTHAINPKWTYRLFPWDEIIAHPRYSAFAAMSEAGTLEGLVAVRRAEDALEVSFLSAAPWNVPPTKLRAGIGAGLISFCILLSRAVGLSGRLRLSSTPESQEFYEYLGFDRTGLIDHEGLNIFFLEESRSAAILNAYPAILPRPEAR